MEPTSIDTEACYMSNTGLVLAQFWSQLSMLCFINNQRTVLGVTDMLAHKHVGQRCSNLKTIYSVPCTTPGWGGKQYC